MSTDLSRRASERAEEITKRTLSPEYRAKLNERIERAKSRAATMDFTSISRRAARAADRIRENYARSREGR